MENNRYSAFIGMIADMVYEYMETLDNRKNTVVRKAVCKDIWKQLELDTYKNLERYLTKKLLGTGKYVIVR